MAEAAREKTSLERHKDRFAHCYRTGVLVPEDHMRLVEDIDFYAEKAGIPAQDLWRHAKETLNDRERMWVREVLRKGSKYGYALVGSGKDQTKAARCRAMVAGCVRNFTNARFVTRRNLIRRLDDGDPDMFEVRLVACPDFIPDEGGMSDYEATVLSSWLLDRWARRRYTAIGVPSAKHVAKLMGGDAMRLIAETFEATVDPGSKG